MGLIGVSLIGVCIIGVRIASACLIGVSLIGTVSVKTGKVWLRPIDVLNWGTLVDGAGTTPTRRPCSMNRSFVLDHPLTGALGRWSGRGQGGGRARAAALVLEQRLAPRYC